MNLNFAQRMAVGAGNKSEEKFDSFCSLMDYPCHRFGIHRADRRFAFAKIHKFIRYAPDRIVQIDHDILLVEIKTVTRDGSKSIMKIRHKALEEIKKYEEFHPIMFAGFCTDNKMLYMFPFAANEWKIRRSPKDIFPDNGQIYHKVAMGNMRELITFDFKIAKKQGEE